MGGERNTEQFRNNEWNNRLLQVLAGQTKPMEQWSPKHYDWQMHCRYAVFQQACNFQNRTKGLSTGDKSTNKLGTGSQTSSATKFSTAGN